MSRVRLVPVLVIAFMTLAVLFGGWKAYDHFKLLQPLQSNLTSIAGVSSVNLNEVSDGGPIVIQLGPVQKLKDGDLQQTYQEIVSNIRTSMATDVLPTIVDHHNEALVNASESYNFIFNEGIAKYNYSEMKAKVEALAKADHIAIRMTMDQSNLYVQMSQGSYYLYEIIPLHQGGGAS